MNVTTDREGKTVSPIFLCHRILPYSWKIPGRYGGLTEDGGDEISMEVESLGLVPLFHATGECVYIVKEIKMTRTWQIKRVKPGKWNLVAKKHNLFI